MPKAKYIPPLTEPAIKEMLQPRQPGEDMTETIETTVFNEIDAYNLIEAEAIRQEAHLKELKRDLLAAEERIIGAFLDLDDPSAAVTRHGKKWKLDMTTDIRPMTIEDDKVTSAQINDDVVQWIETHGGESLTVPAMHWSKRNKFLRDTLIDDDGNVVIPDELQGLIRVDDRPTLKRTAVR
jgi:hypothetical protein